MASVLRGAGTALSRHPACSSVMPAVGEMRLARMRLDSDTAKKGFLHYPRAARPVLLTALWRTTAVMYLSLFLAIHLIICTLIKINLLTGTWQERIIPHNTLTPGLGSNQDKSGEEKGEKMDISSIHPSIHRPDAYPAY